MKKYTFLLPLFNDWESFTLISDRINSQMKQINKHANIVIINDNSTKKPPNFSNHSNILDIKILNLNKNLGSQKAISVGLQYLKKNEHDSIITILDSDGEDDVAAIPKMIENAENNKDNVIVSSRTKRQENFFFKILYFSHKIITFFFTLNWISYGNYSSFHSNQLSKILINSNSWLAFSACVAKNCKIIKVEAERKKRLIGVSKLSFMGLVFHSLRVNTVFILRGIFLSIFYTAILLTFFGLNLKITSLTIILVALYNFLLLITLILNKQNDFYNFEHYINNN